jgi:hypothetical protein
MDDSEIVGEVQRAYRHYVDTFNRRDAAEFARHYDRPNAGLSSDQGLVPVNSDADQERWCQEVIANADRQCWVRTDIDSLQVWPFSPSLAQLVADVSRYREDGSVLQRIRTSFMLRCRDGRWKVMTYCVVEEPFSGPRLLATRPR